ncbi:MAG: trimethylamine methyltransferase family protein [Chloroflexi bacterium OHK40]
MAPSDRRAARREQRRRSPLASLPFQVLESPIPPVELLDPEQLERIHDASMRIVEEIGLDFLDPEALAIWEQAGARVDHSAQHVWIDRGLLLEAVARAPSEFTLRARNPAHNVRVGGRRTVFVSTSGTAFVSDLERGRRPGTLADLHELAKIVQMCPPIHVLESQITEPQDVPVQHRHLERGLAIFTLSDKPVAQAAHGRRVAEDCLAMAAIVFGGMEEVRRQPVFAAIVNANSPLRWDTSMVGGLLTYARGGQPLVVTPFILAGAMSPITMAAAMAQQNAEALAAIALAQIVNPGVPIIYGGFTTNTDMASGGPAFGTPEGAWAFFAGAQLARRYGLPYRGSGGLNTSKLPDAQAAYETQMCLWPNVLSHTNWLQHAAGWLESGLVCSYEKLVLDVEGLAAMQHLMRPVEVSEATLALDMIREVGPGGHHFGTAHTAARYQSEFFRPIIADRQNIGMWEEQGRQDAAQRAARLWRELLAGYEQPPIDAAVAEELRAFVARRKAETPVS